MWIWLRSEAWKRASRRSGSYPSIISPSNSITVYALSSSCSTPIKHPWYTVIPPVYSLYTYKIRHLPRSFHAISANPSAKRLAHHGLSPWCCNSTPRRRDSAPWAPMVQWKAARAGETLQKKGSKRPSKTSRNQEELVGTLKFHPFKKNCSSSQPIIINHPLMKNWLKPPPKIIHKIHRGNVKIGALGWSCLFTEIKKKC